MFKRGQSMNMPTFFSFAWAVTMLALAIMTTYVQHAEGGRHMISRDHPEGWSHEKAMEVFKARKNFGPALTLEEQRLDVEFNILAAKEHKRRRLEETHKAIEDAKPRIERSQVCKGDNCFTKGLRLNIQENRGILFCKNCPDPQIEGSWMQTWEAHWRPKGYNVNGILTFAVPNDAHIYIHNDEFVRGHVALVTRGRVALVTKIKHCQDAGAVAVIIIDSEENCDPRTDGVRCNSKTSDSNKFGSKEGFAVNDVVKFWDDIRIPAVMITKKDGERLKRLMHLETMVLDDLGGEQYLDIHQEL